MYTKNIPTMKDITGEYPDVTFLLIYVREAHPGERLGPHQNFDEKVEAARLVKPRYNEHRRVLVDNLAGDFHRGYGAMPNVLYVIRPDGTIHYRCNWATPEKVREVLNDRETYHTHENADLFELRASRAKMHMIRTMWTGGIVALYDFVKGAPFVVSKHVKTDAYYKKAQQVRTLFRRDFQRVFSACDALLTPVSPTPAFRLGERLDDPLQMYLADIFTIPMNLAGVPALSVPCGLTTTQLPIGLQIAAPPFREDVLLQVGAAFEAVTDYHTLEPGGPAPLTQEGRDGL